MKKSLIFPVSNVSLHISLLFVLSLKAKIFVLSGRFLGHLSYIYLSLQAWLWARARNTNLKPASQTGILGGFWVLIEKCSMMNILQHYIDRISFSLLGLRTGARSQSFASDIWAASSPGAGRTVGRPEVKITSQSTSQSTATTATTSTTDIHLSVSSYQYMYTHNLDIVSG